MSKIRIVCKAPPPIDPGPYSGTGLRSDLAASLDDAQVFAVGDDGAEVQLTNVERIVWTAEQNEPTRAVISFLNAEIDAEAVR